MTTNMHIDAVAIIPCAYTRYAHSCEETRGIWMMKVTGQTAFYCRHHAVDVIYGELLAGRLTEINIRHLDSELLLDVETELFCAIAEAYQETSEYDRDDDFIDHVQKIGDLRRMIVRVIKAKTAQLDLTLI